MNLRFAIGALVGPWIVLGIHDFHDALEVHEQYPKYSLSALIIHGPYFFVLAEWIIAYGTFWLIILPAAKTLSRGSPYRGRWDVVSAAVGGLFGTMIYCLIPNEWIGLPHSDQPLNLAWVAMLCCGGVVLFSFAGLMFALIAGHPLGRIKGKSKALDKRTAR